MSKRTKWNVCMFLTLSSWLSCCFPLNVKNWGENCTTSDECFDPRMLCLIGDDDVLKCLCNRFHEWNETSETCVQMYSITYIMNHTVTVSDNIGKEEKRSEYQFQGPMLSIYFMLLVIATSTLSVIFYCLRIRTKDKQLGKLIRGMQSKNESNLGSTFGKLQETSTC